MCRVMVCGVMDGVILWGSVYWLHEASVASCHSQVSYIVSKRLAAACVTSQAATVDDR